MWGIHQAKTLATLIVMSVLLASIAFAAPRLVDVSVSPLPAHSGDTIRVGYTLVDNSVLGEVQTTVVLDDVINYGTVVPNRGDVYVFDESFHIPQDHRIDEPLVIAVKIQDAYPLIAHIDLKQRSQPRVDTQFTVATNEEPNLAYFETRPYSGSGFNVLVDPVRDVLQGAAAYYPVTIQNGDSRDRTVNLGVHNVVDWATFRVDPQPTFTVPANSEQDVFVYIKTDADAPLGQQRFIITADNGNRAYDAEIQVAILEQDPSAREGFSKGVVLLIVVLLLLTAALVVYIIWRNTQPPGENGDETITYY